MEPIRFEIKMPDRSVPAEYIKSTARALESLSELDPECKIYGLDTETAAHIHTEKGALDPHVSKIRLMQLSDGKVSFVYDFFHVDPEIFREFLLKNKFTGHNSIFDLRFFINTYEPKTLVFPIRFECTFIMTRLIQHATKVKDSEFGLAGLSAVSEKLLGLVLDKTLQNSKWHNEALTFEQIEYAAYDPVASIDVYHKLLPYIDRMKMNKVYETMRALQHPLAMAELRGIGFDAFKHKEMYRVWAKELFTAREELAEIIGNPKITSATLAKYLEKTLDEDTLTCWTRTDTGKLKTDAHVFAEFSYLDIVKPILRYAKYEKLTSTYGAEFQKNINTVTKKIHTNFNIAGARTGRLSSSKPNMQQMPRDKEIRSLFCADKGRKLIVADFSQIEVRVAAELSQDQNMLHAYKEGLDIYKFTASKVFNVPYEEITKEDPRRQLAKALVLGLLFGLGAKGFTHYVKKGSEGKTAITLRESEKLIAAFRKTYSGYTRWQQFRAQAAAESGLTRTMLGKIRRLDPAKSYGPSMNTPVQGSASEIISLAMIRIWKVLAKKKLDCYLILSVHDELILDCAEKDVDIVKPLLEDSMVKAYLDVFPKGITRDLVDANDGINWSEAK